MSAGRSLSLSPARRLVTDYVHFGMKVPTVCMERRMKLGPVVAARAGAEPRPGWCAVFTKAMGIVASRTPELRQAFMSLPWPRLYESAESIAAVYVERDLAGSVGIGAAHLRRPETLSLTTIQDELRRAKAAPISEYGPHRRALRFARWPTPLRRLAWWVGLNLVGKQRARHFGTYGVTAMASTGSTSFHVLTPLTTLLYYTVFSPAGEVDVRLAFDHRVFDGGVCAQALADLEQVMLSEIAAELRGSSRVAAA